MRMTLIALLLQLPAQRQKLPESITDGGGRLKVGTSAYYFLALAFRPGAPRI